jgi:hypothetical protein
MCDTTLCANDPKPLTKIVPASQIQGFSRRQFILAVPRSAPTGGFVIRAAVSSSDDAQMRVAEDTIGDVDASGPWPCHQAQKKQPLEDRVLALILCNATIQERCTRCYSCIERSLAGQIQ